MTETGSDWLEMFSLASFIDLKNIFPVLFDHWKEWPPTIPQIDEMLQDKRLRNKVQDASRALPPPSNCWREKVVSDRIAANPEWIRRNGESRMEYHKRMQQIYEAMK